MASWPALLACWSVVDDRRMLLLSILYRLLRCLLGLIAVLVRRGLGKDAERRCCISGRAGTVDSGLCAVQMARASSVKTIGSRWFRSNSRASS
jgi:hypothetical protein